MEINYDKNIEKLSIPLGAAVSAKFRGAFCEATVNAVDKKIYCRVQLDDKKTIKVKEEDITGSITVNNKVRVNLETRLVSGIILKVIDNSVYHVVFNDGDTGILRRNQLVLKGDRHFKLSECLDRHPLTNPEQFTKAVVNEKRLKEKSDVEEEEFENDDIKSCSQESMTTVSSSKTRSRQQTVASSASVGTGGSSVTTKTLDDVQKTAVNFIKTKKNTNSKYSLGSLVIVSKVIMGIGVSGTEKIDKKQKAFVGLIVSSSIYGSESAIIKVTQCVVKSFRDNNCYVVYKKDLELVVKRDTLIKHKESEPSSTAYVEKSIIFFDLKILPDNWDVAKLMPATDCLSTEGAPDSEKVTPKSTGKSKTQSSRTSISSLDSDSNVEDDNEVESEHSNEEDQNAKDEWVARFYGFWEDKGSPINNALEIMKTEVDLYRLYDLVQDYGGFQKVTSNIRWPHLYHLMKLPHASSDCYQKLQQLYKRYIFPYVEMKRKLGTFEQIPNRRSGDKSGSTVQKARPLLSARERREYQQTSKQRTATAAATEGCSVSSQSACDRTLDDVGSCASPRADRAPAEATTDGEDEPKVAADHPPSSPSQKPLTDSVSTADSTNSTLNDVDAVSSTPYKASYSGWHERHDTPGGLDRNISDQGGQDSVSECSSPESSGLAPLSDCEAVLPMAQLCMEDSWVPPPIDGGEQTLPLLSDARHDQDSPASSRTNETESKSEPVATETVDSPAVSTVPPAVTKKVTVKRRRSRSACVVEPDHIVIKRLPTVPESRIIASLNLYKSGDKMPKRPIRKTVVRDENEVEPTLVKIDIEQIMSEHCGGKRHRSVSGDSVVNAKLSKLEPLKTDKVDLSDLKTERMRSPSFSNESVSDASTISFREEDNQLLFFLEHGEERREADDIDREGHDEGDDGRRRSHQKSTPGGHKRGRKPLYRSGKKVAPPVARRSKDSRQDIGDADSNSSQHSGSEGGRRVTRSVRHQPDRQPQIGEEASAHLEEDSQTSQDGACLSLVPPITPLATGTPTPASRSRRPPQARRKHRHSRSNSSSAECACPLDSNGEGAQTVASPAARTALRPPGRTFQRLHPSLVPNHLHELIPEERVKLLEALIRQTHLNFLDTKDKLKYVEKRISEIKSSRANGHSIESDEEKFR